MENLQTQPQATEDVVTDVEQVDTVAHNEVAKVDTGQTEQPEQSLGAIQEQAKQLEAEKQQLKEDTLKLRLEQEGLGFAKDFATSYSPSENIEKQVDMILQLIAEIKVDMGFKPKEVAKQDDYTAHQQKGDAKSMIASKLSKLFK
ncbi:hypothetical protein ACQKNC_11310 [Lysinibacillus sp. NPDC094177]|uniref:hypothetical protein n=1 Tax=Lysinibacillus sp. NPDC094177 TaxID=3390580 RepID=UPI003CFBDF59